MQPRARIVFAVSALFLGVLASGALNRAAPSESTRTHTIVIAQMKFSPAELRILPGDRVIFRNNDLLPHTATARDAKPFDSGLIKAGDSWTTSFAEGPQSIRYVCLYHPTMEGRIIVGEP